MSLTAKNPGIEPPMSDTRHLSELKFEERPLSSSTAQAVESAAPKTENFTTDVVMLQKADVWMSQFKTRLNVGIITMVVLWGSVSYYKSTEMQMGARIAPTPEQIIADGSMEGEMPVHAVDGDSLNREAPAQAIETEEPALVEKPAVLAPPVKTVKAIKPVKKSLAKAPKNKNTGGKLQSKTQKKIKKSLAAKPAS